MSKKIINSLSGAPKNSRTTKKRKSRKKGDVQRISRSYNTYMRYREMWEEKGYKMVPARNRWQYREEYRLAKDAGMKQIARKFAADDRVVKGDEARKLLKTAREMQKKKEEEVKKKKKQAEEYEEKRDRGEELEEEEEDFLDEFGEDLDTLDKINKFLEEFGSIDELIALTGLSKRELFEMLVHIETKDGNVFGSGWMSREDVEAKFGY